MISRQNSTQISTDRRPGAATVKVAGALLVLNWLAVCAADTGLDVSFADPAWDGITVPSGHQCQKFGGTFGSPALRVNGIPASANALIIEFSDRSYPPMDDGGHGKLGYEIEPGTPGITIPSAPPHTTQLPPGFWTVAEHGAPGWDTSGAYLPPCSGGKGNAYYVTVRAVTRDGDTLLERARAVLELGNY